MGHSLPAGAECHFTASIQDGLYKKVPELHTSCTIQDDESTVTLPVVCSSDSSGPQPQCSCQCAQGFVADAEVNHPQLLTCLSKTVQTSVYSYMYATL